jgi:hypothetical protein
MLTASVISLHDEGCKHFWNESQFLPDYKAQHPRKQSSSHLTDFDFIITTLTAIKVGSSTKNTTLLLSKYQQITSLIFQFNRKENTDTKFSGRFFFENVTSIEIALTSDWVSV